MVCGGEGLLYGTKLLAETPECTSSACFSLFLPSAISSGSPVDTTKYPDLPPSGWGQRDMKGTAGVGIVATGMDTVSGVR